jgi:hypothetical protein
MFRSSICHLAGNQGGKETRPEEYAIHVFSLSVRFESAELSCLQAGRDSRTSIG